MNWAAVTCWTLLLLAAFFCENVTSKGGRGGARGAARGRSRSSSSSSRMRMKSAPRYSSSGSAFRVAAAASAGAAAGAAAGAVAGAAGRRMSGEVGTSVNLERDLYYSNQTGEGIYSYRWTSGTDRGGVEPNLSLCLTLGFFQLFHP
ncbi:shadow of prion protein [Monodelphis domestica]|uniref:Shadow of prion protein n=1 Tax=Monodelphis domestica TaxID=13616 RepID=A2BDG4_MONDO|nr:shadow of prion protein [Monodelphis domestica]XP_056653953.1 shadow of prion protein [Monodelphis domestica]CAJ43800.1 TPA: shadoo protein Sho [Monodelphis domestica]